MTLVSTYQDHEVDISAQGGVIHIFRPIDLFFLDKEEAVRQL